MYQLYVFILKFISIYNLYINYFTYILLLLLINYIKSNKYNLIMRVGMFLNINGPHNKSEKDFFYAYLCYAYIIILYILLTKFMQRVTSCSTNRMKTFMAVIKHIIIL